MTDLEIIKRCAEKMIFLGEYRAFHAPVDDDPWVEFPDGTGGDYDPLHDDAQCFALVRKLKLDVYLRNYEPALWGAGTMIAQAESNDLNRAICECVAKL